MDTGTWGLVGSLLMAAVILGRVAVLTTRWFRTNAERTARNRRIAEQDAAHRRRLEARIAGRKDDAE